MSDQPPGDDVGYGKPPKHSQFKKGQSGNPSGQKKPAKFDALFKAALMKQAKVPINGKTVTMTMLELILQQVVRKAANGDLPAIKTVLALTPFLPVEDVDDEPITAHQLAMLKDLIADGVELGDG